MTTDDEHRRDSDVSLQDRGMRPEGPVGQRDGALREHALPVPAPVRHARGELLRLVAQGRVAAEVNDTCEGMGNTRAIDVSSGGSTAP